MDYFQEHLVKLIPQLTLKSTGQVAAGFTVLEGLQEALQLPALVVSAVVAVEESLEHQVLEPLAAKALFCCSGRGAYP